MLVIEKMPWLTMSDVEQLTGMNKNFVRSRMKGAEKGEAMGGHKSIHYPLDEVMRVFVRNTAAAMSEDGEMDPDKLSPTDRKAWFDSELKKIQVEEKERTLIPAHEVEATLATAYASVSQGLRAIPDNLERIHGIEPELAETVGNIIEAQMDSLANKLESLCSVT